MPYIDPSVVEEVKQIDLLSYLRDTAPFELIKLGSGEYCMRSHDSLKISSNGLWNWFSRGIGGNSALEYLIRVKDMPFTDAVTELMGQRCGSISAPDISIKRKPSGLLLPEKHVNNDAVLDYLARVRCLDKDIVTALIDRGLIYESRFGGHTNAIFIGTDAGGVYRQASIRGVMSLYKSEAVGSDKHFAFNIPAKSSDTIRVFESAIDLVSFMTLSKMAGRSTSGEHLISLSGVFRPKNALEESTVPVSIRQYCHDYKGISKAILHLDNDMAGKLAADALMEALPKIGLSAISKPPRKTKDFNDYLRAYAKEAPQKNRER